MQLDAGYFSCHASFKTSVVDQLVDTFINKTFDFWGGVYIKTTSSFKPEINRLF